MKMYDWARWKTDRRVESYYQIKDDPSNIDGIVYRCNRIVIPETLQKQVVRIGHQGQPKTKQLIQEKYWFPRMNKMIDQAIVQCYKYKVATKENRLEPIKSTTIPSRS